MTDPGGGASGRTGASASPPTAWFKRGWVKVSAIVAAALTAALTQVLTGWFTSLGRDSDEQPGSGPGTPSAPLALAPQISYQLSDQAPFVVAKDFNDLSTPSGTDSEHGFAAWARSEGGVMAKFANLTITVQNSADRAIILTGLAVESEPREAPLQGIIVTVDGGGGIFERLFTVTLTRDDASPNVWPVPSVDLPAEDFPFRVSALDPEVLVLSVDVENCLCSWRARLDWVADGEPGSTHMPPLTEDPYALTSLPSHADTYAWLGEEYGWSPPLAEKHTPIS
jgi:hypothetical protein